MIKSLAKMVASFLNAIKAVVTIIKNVLSCVGGFFVGIFVFLKGLIDLVYRILFIAFFCVLAYICYRVYNSAGTINKKLDEIKTTVAYIQKATEEFSKSAEKISKVSNEMSKATEKAGGLTNRIKKLF